MKRFVDAGRALDKLWQVDAFTPLEIDGQVVKLLGTRLWHGDIASLAYLAVIIAVSYITFQWIEKPARDWVRRRAAARQPEPAGSLRMTPG